MSALNAALCRCGIILWLAVLLASRSTHSAPVYDQDTTQIAEYDGAVAGCYFNFQRYQEGDRIITSEPCLNCTCHNRMLMCYLKVCPFTKAIGQDCTVEKRPDQCCPVITCPEVPVQLLTSTTTAPATSDSTEIGFHDNYGCHVNNKFYADGVQLATDHQNPCELCYCIRNRTTCVMQECTLQVAGCKPVYQPGVCCPIKYNCDYDEELSTTVAPTTGLIMTTTLPPGVLPQCYHEGTVYEDGESINSTLPCQHCYCFRGEIACAVQNCGTPMQAHGKNCTALPPPEGECCPTTYECEEDGQPGVVTLPRGEEQIPYDFQTTESPALIDQEEQVTDHPKKETFPGADNAIPHEEEGIQGSTEYITEQHITSTEKSEEKPATLPEENIVLELETISPQEHFTETLAPETIPEEPITAKLPSETEVASTEVPTTVEKTEELDKEKPTVKLPESSEGLKPQEEIITTALMPEEHVSTEENIIDTELEEGQPTQTSSSDGTQTESSIKQEQDITSPHKELPTQVPEEAIEIEKATEEIQISVTETPNETIASTESIEKITSPESVTEFTKEDGGKVYSTETTLGEILATETESPIKQPTIIENEVSSTEQTGTEKEEIHPTEETSSTETSVLLEEEQLPTIAEGEKKQESEKPPFEHTITEDEDGAKKEDVLTEAPTLSEDSVTADEQHKEKVTPEISTEESTSISIPERIPVQKADDENIYHMTEDITRPEVISPDNLITEVPQKQPTEYPSADYETTFAPAKQTVKPIPEEITEENLPTQKESSITESTAHEEITSSVAYSSSEPSITTIPYDQSILEEGSKPTEKPTLSAEITTEVQLTEEALINRLGLPTEGIKESSESISTEVSGEEELYPKKEQSTQPSVVTKPEAASGIPASIPIEYSTELPDHGKEQTGDEKITTEISMIEGSTPQTEQKETEIIPTEEEKPVTSEKPEHATEESIIPTISETEKGLQSELETTESAQTIKETEEKLTTQISIIEEEKTEKSDQPSTVQVAVTEIHGLQETKIPIIEGEPETIITEKEPSVEKEVTQIISIEQTELPVTAEYPTEKIKEENEEKMSTEGKLETTEISTTKKETEEKQTESSIIEESSQPPITDLKEDEEQKPSKEEQESEEQTQSPASKDEEPQKQTILPEKEATIPLSEEAVTQSITSEEKLPEGTTEPISIDEIVTKPATEEQPEIASIQPSGQEKETHDTEKPDIQIRKETETPSPVTYEEPHVTSASTEKPVKTEESFTTPILISEISTELPGLVEEDTKYEGDISVEKEIVTESLPSEEDTKIPILEEKPSQEEAEVEEVPAEVSTEEIAISETPKVPIEEQQPEVEISKEITTKISIHEHEEYSTLAPEETKIPTEAPSKETSQYSTEYPTSSIPEEIPVEKEIIPEISPRPAGIPGEGNCLVEGQSYNNNSAVPPSNACQTTCRCISSIIQCELVQCPSPPAHLSNCMPIHTSGDLCCPMYACDSVPTVELESGNHMIESHTHKVEEEEEGEKTALPVEISTAEPVLEITEATKESSTLSDEISTSKLGPTEIIIPSVTESEEAATTLKPIEPGYEQPTEKISEEHTISTVSSTLPQEESIKHTEPQNISEDTTEGKVSEEASTSTEQASEEPVEKYTSITGEDSSTQATAEQKPHGAKEESTIPPYKEEEITVPVITKEEESSISTEKAEEITTIVSTKEEELIPSKEEKKPIEEQPTVKPIEEIEKEHPKEETTIPVENPVTDITEEEEIPIKVEEPSVVTEVQTEKPEISEEQKTIEPTKYEDKEITTEIEQAAQTEKPEIDTRLSAVYPSELETQKPIESSTLIHDHTPAEQVPLEEYTTLKSVETSTEEGKVETEEKISTEAPIIEEEYSSIPTSSIKTETSSEGTTKQEVDKDGEEIIKPTEAFIPEISHKEVTESTTGIESTGHSEEQTEIPVTEQTERPSVTKLPEENLPEPILSEVSTEQPLKTIEEEGPKEEPQKPTESSITQEPGSTIEEHPEITSGIESYTTVSPAEEHTVFETIQPTSTTVQEEVSEEPAIEIIKDISKPSESKPETEQPPVPEAETQAPTIEEEHVTVLLEEQTQKTEEQSIGEQTVVSLIPTESEMPESITSQEQLTEKTIEDTKTATDLPELIDKQTIIPEIQKEEEQIPEAGITEQPVKEEAVTSQEETTKEKVESDVGTTEKTPSIEKHTEKPEIISSETESTIKAETPIKLETTTILIKEPEQEIEITSEISLPEHPVSEEATTTASVVPEKYPTTLAETEEKESTSAPEYSTTLSALEKEISKPTTEGGKVPLEEELTTVQGETITPIIEERLPEEVDTEKKSTEAPSITSVEEEIHPTIPIEITSPHEESITELQPGGGFTPSEEETLAPEEIQPSQPVEGEEIHTSLPEESQPTEHAPEMSATIETEEHSEIEQTSTEAALPELPIKISGVLPEEKVTIKPALPEEIEPEGTIKPEEIPQSTETSIENVTKISAELPITSTTEETSEENEEAIQQHIDNFPKPTTKPEPDYSVEGELTLGSDEEHLRPVNHTMETDQPFQPDSFERPITTLAPHISEYTDQSVSGEDNAHFPIQGGGYISSDEDYDEDDQAIYGPGTCRYGGKVFVSAQQIPRDDPCDFCFCFRSDIICLQQSCPPPIPGCHEEPISGFCCPRYECPVSMATAVNLTTTTTTTTTTLPPHFHANVYKGAARRSGCQIRGQAYRVGEVIKSASGPCLHCTCGGDGNMKCDPRVCTPEPMLRQMIAAATSKRRR